MFLLPIVLMFVVVPFIIVALFVGAAVRKD